MNTTPTWVSKARLLFYYVSIGLALFYAYTHWHDTEARVPQDPKIKLLQAVVIREMHSGGLDTLVPDQGNMTSQAFDAVSSDPTAMAMRLTDAQVLEKAQLERIIMARADSLACQEIFDNSIPKNPGEPAGINRVLVTMTDSQVAALGRLYVASYRANVTHAAVGQWYVGKDLDDAFDRATSKLPLEEQTRFRWLRAHHATLAPTEQCEWLKDLNTAAAQLEPTDGARFLRGVWMWTRPSPFNSVAHTSRP